MPTHGYGAFRRFILGSVTAKILHDADCPVLTGIHVAGAPANQEFGMANIACAIDLGPDSQRVLGWADQFANTFGSHLTALHITPAWDRFLGDGVDLGWRANLTREAEVHVEHVRNAVSANAEILVDTGNDVPSDVCSAAGRLEANLMIIGRGGFGKSVGRLRSNAYAIIRQSPCPVISV
jgi:nucleotide-binding universal stress UspA family protein